MPMLPWHVQITPMSRPHFLKVAEFRGGYLDKSGGPPHDGDMDQRVTRLEVVAETLSEGIRDLGAEVRAFRTEMRDDLHALRAEMRAERAETRSDTKSLRANIWLAAITTISITFAAMYGIVQTTIAAIDTGRASAQAQTASQPPIIINVPTPAAAPAPGAAPKR